MTERERQAAAPQGRAAYRQPGLSSPSLRLSQRARPPTTPVRAPTAPAVAVAKVLKTDPYAKPPPRKTKPFGGVDFGVLGGASTPFDTSAGPVPRGFVPWSPNGPYRNQLAPNVWAARQFVTASWGITNIGGFATHGHVVNSDHYTGHALDVMNPGRRGDAIAAWFIANGGAYRTKYVIWNRRIWTPQRGWHTYHGTNPHTDHVHLSFN